MILYDYLQYLVAYVRPAIKEPGGIILTLRDVRLRSGV